MWQSKNDADELSIETWKRFIDSFASFVEGNSQVQLVGGEPLRKKGVLDLITHAANKGLSTTMTTSGYLLNKDVAKNVIDSGLNTIVFSLDSIKEEIHDSLRGRDGVYSKVMEAIETLSKINKNLLNMHVVTTIMQPNLEDIIPLAEWVNKDERLGHISFQAIMQPFFTPQEDDWHNNEEFSFLWPKDTNKVVHVLDRLIELKNKGYKIFNPVSQFELFKSYFRSSESFIKRRCHLGYNSITVDTAGRIYLCNSMEPIGNIQEEKDIKELWFSEKAFRVRGQIRACKRNCKLMINCFFEEEKGFESD